MGMLPPAMPPIRPRVITSSEIKKGECELCGKIADIVKHKYHGEKIKLCDCCADDLDIRFVYLKPQRPKRPAGHLVVG